MAEYKEFHHGGAVIRVYRPDLTKDERAKRENHIAAALQQYGRQIHEGSKGK